MNGSLEVSTNFTRTNFHCTLLARNKLYFPEGLHKTNHMKSALLSRFKISPIEPVIGSRVWTVCSYSYSYHSSSM